MGRLNQGDYDRKNSTDDDYNDNNSTEGDDNVTYPITRSNANSTDDDDINDGSVLNAYEKITSSSTTSTELNAQSKPFISAPKQSANQRIIFLPGPHKSASTSVQVYLVQLSKEGILENHNWHWVGNDSAKGFSDVARQLLYEPEFDKNVEKLDKIQRIVKEQWDGGRSLVVAAEFMDYVAALSEEDAQVAIGRLISWLPKTSTKESVEAVVMYRSPRSAHLISAWKQQVQFRMASSTLPWRKSLDKQKQSRKKFGDAPTLAEWLCLAEYPHAMKYNIETILAAQLNPFGVAHAYSKHGDVDVSLMDMSGVPDGDVPSSVVCDVLGLPCKNNKLAAGQTTESSKKNHKKEKVELGLTDEHLAEAEEIIRDADCHYYCLLGEKVKVFHGSDKTFVDERSWESCCQRSQKKEVKTDGKWMAEKLIELGCRALEQSRTLSI